MVDSQGGFYPAEQGDHGTGEWFLLKKGEHEKFLHLREYEAYVTVAKSKFRLDVHTNVFFFDTLADAISEASDQMGHAVALNDWGTDEGASITEFIPSSPVAGDPHGWGEGRVLDTLYYA